ncbi:MAG: hypothetical protein V1824_02990 [archaeon]
MAKPNIKGLRIIRALLTSPNGSLTRYSLSKKLNISRQWIIEFLRTLESLNLVKDTKVIDLNKLIDYYIKIDTLRQKKYHFYISSPLEFLKDIKFNYALTTYSAENIVNHHLFPHRFDVYISKEDFTDIRDLIIKKGLVGNGNLTLIISNDENILTEAEKIRGLNVVSIPQLLIDLKKEGGVCIEAYNILLERYIKQTKNKIKIAEKIYV